MKIVCRAKGVSALFLLLAGLDCVPGSPAGRFDRARGRIEDAIAAGELPAFAVAVSRNEEVLWGEAFGLADVDVGRKRPATTDSRFSLASVSKPLTATALLIFAERGDRSRLPHGGALRRGPELAGSGRNFRSRNEMSPPGRESLFSKGGNDVR